MVVRRRKKVVKYRGSVTHGGGHRKKRRGAGSRGGRGRAGTGKRAGQKKAGMPPQLGRHGFTSRKKVLRRKLNVINLGDFTPKLLERWVHEGKAKQEKGSYVVNLAASGYDKLLGAGATSLKLEITVRHCSRSAREKIAAAGGTVHAAALSVDKKTKKTKEKKISQAGEA